MKLAIFLVALVFGAVIAKKDCSNWGNNKPDCDGEKNVTHTDDHSAYWHCDGSGGEAQKLRCDDGDCFSSTESRCVKCGETKFVHPCQEGQTGSDSQQ